MRQMSIREIARAAGAAYDGKVPSSEPDMMISHISTDSRDIPPGCLFVALEGDRFDGHDYAAAALEQGAAFALVSREVDAAPDRLLLVKDTRQAYLAIAGYHRRRWGGKVVGVTGSVGKTTTKEFIARVCEAAFPTLKTSQNLNNEVGLSQMMLALAEEHRAAVLEMAMDAPGQIAPLSRAAAPDIGVVTNIGVSHLEAMGTRENIRDEKLSIRAGMADGAALILNGDDDLLAATADPRLALLFYGIDNGKSDIQALEIKEISTHTTFQIRYNDSLYGAEIPAMGRHNVANALAAFAVGVTLGIPPEAAAGALADYAPAGMRQRIVEHKGVTIVEDCYNASPDSMRAALDTLGAMECRGRRIAVLSDMLELGSLSEQAHREVGRLAARNADLLLCTGPQARLYAAAARAAGLEQAIHLETQEALAERLKAALKPGDIAWFKASRGMKLETVMRRLYDEL